MKFPRITVPGLLVVAAILAVDMAAFELLRRTAHWNSWEAEVLLSILPPINALAIGLYLLVRQLRLRGEVRPFLVGFEAAGWTAVAVVLIAELSYNMFLFPYKQWVLPSFWRFWGYYIEWPGGIPDQRQESMDLGFVVIALAGLALLAAAFGGWFVRLLGVSVVRGTVAAGRPRAIPAQSALAATVVVGAFLGTGIWGAKVQGRWHLYSGVAQQAAWNEKRQRSDYEQTLATVRSLERIPCPTGDDAAWRASRRRVLLLRAERQLRIAKGFAGWRKIYERAARRPWLPIPPNPPLDPWSAKGTPPVPSWNTLRELIGRLVDERRKSGVPQGVPETPPSARVP